MTIVKKTLITPEMATSIKADFARLVQFWEDAVAHGKEQDDVALGMMGLLASDFEDAGVGAAYSVDTEWAIDTLDTLRELVHAFENGLTPGPMYLEDGMEFYAGRMSREQESNPDNYGVIGAYANAQSVLKTYL
jgi:hypothetical protein